MKKALKFIGIYIIIGLISFGIFRLSDKYQLRIIRNNIECSVLTKGCEGAIALACDNGTNIYIAFPNYIKEINSEGKESVIYKSKSGIEDIECKGEKLYVISENNLIEYNLVTKAKKVLLDDIPEGGNKIKRNLMIYENKLLVTISASTNSGLKDDGSVEYIPTNSKDKIGNATIYQIDLSNNTISLYASGIRGITGIDYTDKGEIYAIFTGMKNEGVRPVNRDFDYIYKVKYKKWYGFPDFSGGDYITSPRFANENLLVPILKTPITKRVDAPYYVSNSLDGISELAIDKNGEILPKNSLLFWNTKSEIIQSLIDGKAIFDVIRLTDDSKIDEMKYHNGELLLLDSGVGCLFSVHKKIGISSFNLPVSIWVFVVLLIIGIIAIIFKKNLVDGKHK